MGDFRVKLHAEVAPGRIGESGDGRIAAVCQHAPAFWKIAQRDTRIVLNNDAAVLQQEIAHPGEAIAVHEK